nr:MAG TPA: repressor protein CI [Caudoviricetes sp.]
MKTAKDRFHEVMDSLGLSDYKVYTSIEGITKNMISKLRQGHTEEVSVKILMPFCEAYPQVNANYILTGKGDMFLDTDKSTSENIAS